MARNTCRGDDPPNPPMGLRCAMRPVAAHARGGPLRGPEGLLGPGTGQLYGTPRAPVSPVLFPLSLRLGGRELAPHPPGAQQGRPVGCLDAAFLSASR
jgi:hypothetical protein